MSTEKSLLEAESQPSCLGAVRRSIYDLRSLRSEMQKEAKKYKSNGWSIERFEIRIKEIDSILISFRELEEYYA
jgi:hypothetical protein